MDGGERGLIFDKVRNGVQDKIRGEGVHFFVPGVQRPIIFDIRISPQAISTTTGSRGKKNTKKPKPEFF